MVVVVTLMLVDLVHSHAALLGQLFLSGLLSVQVILVMDGQSRQLNKIILLLIWKLKNMKNAWKMDLKSSQLSRLNCCEKSCKLRHRNRSTPWTGGRQRLDGEEGIQRKTRVTIYINDCIRSKASETSPTTISWVSRSRHRSGWRMQQVTSGANRNAATSICQPVTKTVATYDQKNFNDLQARGQH